MVSPAQLGPQTCLSEMMQRWPQTIYVFLERQMLCVGCPIGPFHTVEDACREYGLDQAGLLRELRAAVNEEERLQAPPEGGDG